MGAEDHDAERERLIRLYAQMSECELQEIASAAVELTDTAREVLTSEISRRGLGIRLALYPAGEEAEFQELVTIGTFMNLHEALLAKCNLESASIECHLVDDEMIRINWLYTPILGGVKLQVRPEDSEAASELLRQPLPESLDLKEQSDLDAPPTPNQGPVSE